MYPLWTGFVIVLFAALIWFGFFSIMLYARCRIKGPSLLFAAVAVGMMRILVSENAPDGGAILDLIVIGLFLAGAFLLASVESRTFSSVVRDAGLRGCILGEFKAPRIPSGEVNLPSASWTGIVITLAMSAVVIALGINSLVIEQDKFEGYFSIMLGSGGVIYALMLVKGKLTKKYTNQ
jgi:hypothetical protein